MSAVSWFMLAVGSMGVGMMWLASVGTAYNLGRRDERKQSERRSGAAS